MKLALRNRLFAFISFSRIFNILGSSIYNIVFIVFASSMPQPKFAVGIANFIVLVPTFFTVFVGMKADKTIQKARWLIHLGYLQAFLFILVALLTKSASYLAFATVCFLNIFSDIISDYRSGLQMPILQKNIEEKDLMEAYSFTQLLTFLGNFAGQALGVWLLSISQQNFAMVALINALCFLLSSSTLYLIRQKLTHDAPAVAEQKLPFKKQMKDLYQNVQMIFEQEKNRKLPASAASSPPLKRIGRLYHGTLQSLFIGSPVLGTKPEPVSAHYRVLHSDWDYLCQCLLK